MAEFDPPMRYSFREVPPEEELPVKEPEIVVAEVAKPKNFDWNDVAPQQPNLVPGGAATKPPAPTREPKTYGWDDLHPDQSVGTVSKPGSGMWSNIGAGLVEGTTPGLAGALASPVDIPLNIARGMETDVRSLPHQMKAIGRDIGGALGIATPMTNEEFLQGYKNAEKDTWIPANWGARKLTGLAEKVGIPTPEAPIERVVPATRDEEKARRAAQVGSQIASTIAGSKVYKPFTPYYPGKYEPAVSASPAAALATGPAGPVGQLASSLALSSPKFIGSAPALSSGLVAGGANLASQDVGDYGVQQGWSEDKIRAAQALTELGGNVAGGIGATAGSVAKDIARRNVFPRVPNLTDQFTAGLPLGYATQEARQRLAGQQLEKSAVSPLATKSDWEPSTADVGNTLRGNLQTDVDAAIQERLTNQVAATRELGKVGGTVADLDSRIANQQTRLAPDVQGMRFTPEDVGQRLRASAGSQRQGQGGIIDEILAKDQSGAHVVPHSEVPGKVFNKNLSPEDLNDLLWRSKGQFRQAFRDAGLSDFEGAAVKRDLSGNKTGELDLAKAQKWVQDHSPLLDAYERQTEKLWGRPDTSIRDTVSSAATKQRALDNLNSQRNLAIAATPGRTNAQQAAAIWKPGAQGGQAVKEYVATRTPEAIDNLVDLASSSLRTAAEKNGVFDPAAARQWLSSHRDAISQLPPNVRQQFENATRAQELVEARSATRAQDIKDFQTGAAKGYLNGQTPRQAINDIFANTAQDPAIGIRELVARIGNDKPALDALRRDFMEHANDTAMQEASAIGGSAHGTATSASRLVNAFRAFTNKNVSPGDLHQSSLQYMDSMSNFLRKNETSVRALYGDTATDGMKALLKNHTGLGQPHMTVGELFTTGALFLDMFGAHALTANLPGPIKYAAAVGIGANEVVRKLRAMGISKVNELFPLAMTNPTLMRTFLESAKNPGAIQRAMRQLSVITTQEEAGGYGMGEDKSKPPKPFKYPPITIPGGATVR
jgi:hypothetical protein